MRYSILDDSGPDAEDDDLDEPLATVQSPPTAPAASLSRVGVRTLATRCLDAAERQRRQLAAGAELAALAGVVSRSPELATTSPLAGNVTPPQSQQQPRGTSGATRQPAKTPKPQAAPHAPRPRVHETPAVQRVEQDYPPANQAGMDTFERHRSPAGDFTPHRQALHERVHQKLLGNVPRSRDKTYLMMGGGPASGKSSVKDSGMVQLPEHHVLIDSDSIKGELPEYGAMIAAGDDRAAAHTHEESSHLAKNVQARALQNGQDVVLDGTGDNSLESIEKKIQQARKAGYKVNAEYTTCSTKEALRRNLERARKTGRLPPESMLRAVHRGVSQVLPAAVEKGLFDSARLWDTEHHTDGKPTLVMSARGKQMTIHHPERWQAFLGKANEGETELATDDGPLTYRELERVLKQVILGIPAPADESPAARDWRRRCERDVASCRAQGRMPELPFDPTHDEEESPVEMAADDPFDDSSTFGGATTMRAAWDGPDLDDDDDDIGEVPAVAPPSSSGDMMPGACYVRACLSFLRQHGVLLPDDTSPSRFMEDLHHALMHTDPAPGCAPASSLATARHLGPVTVRTQMGRASATRTLGTRVPGAEAGRRRREAEEAAGDELARLAMSGEDLT